MAAAPDAIYVITNLALNSVTFPPQSAAHLRLCAIPPTNPKLGGMDTSLMARIAKELVQQPGLAKYADAVFWNNPTHPEQLDLFD